MSQKTHNGIKLPPDQEAIRARCFHPSGSFVEFPRNEIETSIPDRLEKIAAKYPDRVAVKSGRNVFTYDGLNRRSNQIAQTLLRERGPGQEPVALLFRHDAPVISTILGVLKAGKIYMPLDASAPTTRSKNILEASQARVIIADAEHRSKAEHLANNGLSVLNVDDLESHFSPSNVELRLSADNFAYIMHTSGSTGEPKGVIQTHRNVLKSVMNNTNALRISPEDRLSLIYQYHTNGAAHDIFAGLANGASLHVFDIRAEGLGPLTQWLIQEKITIYHSVRSVFRHFVSDLSDTQDFPDLRIISLGGEPVYKIDVELYRKVFPETCIFVNRLGSTESGRISWHFIDKQTRIEGSAVPVGWATQGYEIAIVDENGEVCGHGQTGEISVKSRYLSPGYWQRPDLTQAKFLTDPDGGEERVYFNRRFGPPIARWFASIYRTQGFRGENQRPTSPTYRYRVYPTRS